MRRRKIIILSSSNHMTPPPPPRRMSLRIATKVVGPQFKWATPLNPHPATPCRITNPPKFLLLPEFPLPS
ncbi:unnamed protein product [Dibothriocephalus latus]|uniref:Uncharacterized protein n=1 Tax=Dibothriocephalus latus TaxID=60516 RepID=A0A3P7RG44_DIBLA|nr:unnamed protein product [Dibothriocephalus latus]